MLAILLVSLAALSQAPASGVAPLPAPIRAALEERSKQCRSLIVEWTEVTTHPRGSFSKIFGGPGAPEAPAQDIQLRTGHRLVLAGDHGHYSYSGDDFHMGSNKILDFKYDSVFDGAKNVVCRYYPGAGPAVQSLGHIYHGKTLKATEDGLLLPLLMSIRPADPTLHIDLPLLDRLTPTVGNVGGERCDILSYPENDNYRAELWFTQRDHHLVKSVHYDRRTPTGMVTISSDVGADGARTPKQWEIIMRLGEPSVLIKVVTAKVKSFRLNPQVNQSEYEYEFPAGVFVSDVGSHKEPGRLFISEGNGRLIEP